MKKILFIDHDHRITGSTVSLKYLLNAFKENGFENILLTSKNEKDIEFISSGIADFVPYGNSKLRTIALDTHFSDDEVFLSVIGFKKFFKCTVKFFWGLIVCFKAIRKIKPDLIYVNEYVSIQASIIGSLLKVPVVTHIRSLFLKEKFKYRRKVLAYFIAHFNDLIFPISKVEGNQISFYQPGFSTKIIVAHEFLDSNSFVPVDDIIKTKKSFGFDPAKKLVIMLGGVVPLKGSLDFIKAAANILSKNNYVQFAIAGKIFDKGPDKFVNYWNECLQIIKQGNFEDSILFMGNVDNIVDLIGVCDILVSPSVETHFARPILEAWAQKKPVIATDILHVVNLVENNVDGLIVGVNKPFEVAACIEKLLSDQQLGNELGGNGFRKAKEKFGKEQGTEIIVKACKELITRVT